MENLNFSVPSRSQKYEATFVVSSQRKQQSRNKGKSNPATKLPSVREKRNFLLKKFPPIEQTLQFHFTHRSIPFAFEHGHV